MKLLFTILTLALAADLRAQSLLGVGVPSDITKSIAKITWMTTTTTTNTDIECGADTSYGTTGYTITHANATPVFSHTALIRRSTAAPLAFAAGTTYHCRVRIAGVSVGSDIPFTTEVDPGDTTDPIAPTSTVDITMPAGTFNADLTLDSDCGNWSTIRTQIAAITGTNHQRVIFPVGGGCEGLQLDFPAHGSSGWVIVQPPAANLAKLPPEGVQYKTANWGTSNMATIIPNVWPVKNGPQGMTTTYGEYGSASPITDCASTASTARGDGHYIAITLISDRVNLLKCSNGLSAYGGSNTITAFAGGTNSSTDPVRITVPNLTGVAVGDVVYLSTGVSSFLAGSTSQYRIIKAISGSGPTLELTLWGTTAAGSPTISGADTIVRTALRLVPQTIAAGAPVGSCTEDTFYYDSSASKAYYCGDPTGFDSGSTTGTWQRIIVPTADGQYKPVSFAANAARYRFIGVEVTTGRIPNPYPTGWDDPYTGNQSTNAFAWGDLVHVVNNNSYIIFDRCFIHKRTGDVNARGGSALRVEGARHLAVINSEMDELDNQRPSSLVYTQTTNSVEGFNHFGSGPTLLQNSYLGGQTQNYFSPENHSFPTTHDLTVRRATFEKKAYYLHGSSENTASAPNKAYNTRQTFELKSGHRIKVTGSRFINGPATLTPGTLFLISPRCHDGGSSASLKFRNAAISSWNSGVVTLASAVAIDTDAVVFITGSSGAAIDGAYRVSVGVGDETGTTLTLENLPGGSGGAGGTLYMVKSHVGVRDIDAQWNLFYKGIEFFGTSGIDTACDGSAQNSYTKRLRFSNNLVIGTDGRGVSSGGMWDDRSGVGAYNWAVGTRGIYDQGSAQDIIVDNNTIYGFKGTTGRRFWTNEGRTGRARFNNNVLVMDSSTITFQGFDSSTGTNGMNANYTIGGSGAWSSNGWVVCCNQTSTGYPANFTFATAEADLKMQNPSLQISDLRAFSFKHDSDYISGGSGRNADGKDRGVDIDRLEQELGVVRNARVRAVGTNTATISYLAPDSDACIVEYGTSSSWGTYTARVSDGGGADRVRNVVIGNGGGNDTSGSPQSNLSSATGYRATVLCAVEQPSLTFTTQ